MFFLVPRLYRWPMFGSTCVINPSGCQSIILSVCLAPISPTRFSPTVNLCTYTSF